MEKGECTVGVGVGKNGEQQPAALLTETCAEQRSEGRVGKQSEGGRLRHRKRTDLPTATFSTVGCVKRDSQISTRRPKE